MKIENLLEHSYIEERITKLEDKIFIIVATVIAKYFCSTVLPQQQKNE